MMLVIQKIFIVLALLYIHIGWSAAVEKQTIVAAYSGGAYLHLLNEGMNRYIFGLGSGVFVGTGYSMASDLLKNETAKLRAMVSTLADHRSFLLYTDNFGLFVDLFKTYEIHFRRLNYGPRREFIRHGGPDAAVRKDGKLMFFKGCEMVIRNKWYKWTKPTDVRKINLPCDVDAAWKVDEDKAMVLKGDQVWTWGPRDQVSGPVKFCDKFKCGNELALKPKP